MKIKDMKYERYTIEKAKELMVPILEKMKKAETVGGLMGLRTDFLAVSNDYRTAETIAYIRFSQNTKDVFYTGEYQYYSECEPEMSEILKTYGEILLTSRHRPELEKILPETVFLVQEVAKKANDPRISEERKKESEYIMEYENLMSCMTFEFNGETMTLSTLQKYFQDSDRSIRRAAFETLGRGLEASGETLDGIFDALVRLRHEMAQKLGYKNYIELGYHRLGRIDYDIDMVRTFRERILKYIVPQISAQKKETARDFGIDKMMFYDNEVCVPDGEPKPMLNKDGIFFEAANMYDEMHPELGSFFKRMVKDEAIDAVAREGKVGGGYATAIISPKQTFILANFNGTAGDIDVMTHELGHAFAMNEAYKLGFDEVGIGGMGTCECHSMGMEMLCQKFMNRFFGADAERYKYKHIYESFEFFAFGSIIDEFQHIIYENPDMTPSQRNEAYNSLEKKYRPHLSFEGMPYLERGTRWQYKMHVYIHPFYYIDYCFAQMVAFGFLLKSMSDYDSALESYLKFLRKGGTEMLSALCLSTGINSPFCEDTIADIANVIPQVLADLKNKIKNQRGTHE